MTEQHPPTTSPKEAAESSANDTEKRYSQAEFDARLEAAMKDKLDRQRRTFEAQQREAKEAAEAKRLEDQEEWKTLANNRAEELRKLKPRAQAAESYEKTVSRIMAKAIEDEPASTQMILNKLSLPDQLEWLEANLSSVKPPAQTTPGMNTNAWARGGGSPQHLTDEEYLAKKRRQMNY